MLEQLNQEELIIGIVREPVARYERIFKCKISVELSILHECFERIDETARKYFESSEGQYNLNAFKMAGIVCFWIRKLKPFSVSDNPNETAKHRLVNEIIAFITGYVYIYNDTPINQRKKLPKILENYFGDLIKSFRYHSHSPHSTAFIFEGLLSR